MTRSSFLSALLCASALATATIPAATLNFNLLVSTTGNNEMANGSPDQIFDENGAAIVHPYNALFTGYYTRFTGLDSFDFDSGGETSLGGNPINGTTYTNAVSPNPPTFSGTIPAGHGLAASGLVSSDSNPIHLAFRGFNLNLASPADFFFDTVSQQETRVYRNGEFAFFEETAPNTYSLVYLASGVDTTVVIDWPEVIDGDSEPDIAVSLSGFLALGADPSYPNFAITGYNATSGVPVQIDGSNANGGFAIYPSTANLGVAFIPEPSQSLLLAFAAAAGLFRRRRSQPSVLPDK